MAKLIILRGNSGSGKTTLAKALQEALGPNTLLISQDVVRRDMLRTRDGSGTTALPLLTMLLEYGRAHCDVTILEGILNSRWYAPLFRRAAALYGEANIHAYYYELPFEETLRRHGTKPIRAEFGEPELRRWWRDRDYAGDLRETALTEDRTLEAATALILKELAHE